MPFDWLHPLCLHVTVLRPDVSTYRHALKLAYCLKLSLGSSPQPEVVAEAVRG